MMSFAPNFLLPGTCCHWKLNFGEVIPLPEQHFRVVCVSCDGFDETENTIFPTRRAENFYSISLST